MRLDFVVGIRVPPTVGDSKARVSGIWDFDEEASKDPRGECSRVNHALLRKGVVSVCRCYDQ